MLTWSLDALNPVLARPRLGKFPSFHPTSVCKPQHGMIDARLPPQEARKSMYIYLLPCPHNSRRDYINGKKPTLIAFGIYINFDIQISTALSTSHYVSEWDILRVEGKKWLRMLVHDRNTVLAAPQGRILLGDIPRG